MTGVLVRQSSPVLVERFSVRVRVDSRSHVVEMTGELDLEYRTAALHSCTMPDHVHVVVDLAHVTFMDCSGYGALVGARAILQGRGGSLSLIGPIGEPLRLLSIIEAA